MNTELQQTPIEQPQESHLQGPELLAGSHDKIRDSLSKLAVMHPSPVQLNLKAFNEAQEAGVLRNANEILEGNSVWQYVREGLSSNVPEWVREMVDSEEKQRTLVAVGTAIEQEAVRHANESGDMPWRNVAGRLLESASERPEGLARNDQLVAATAAAQFSKDPKEKLDFLKSVYDKDLQKDMFDACYASGLVLVLGENPDLQEKFGLQNPVDTFHSMRSLSSAFKADKQHIQDYLHYTERQFAERAANLPSAKKVQKQFNAQPPGEASEETRAVAQEVAVSGEKVGTHLLDIYKVERFALQEEFIKQQMELVLAGPDLAHTALREQLASRRSDHSNVIDESQFAADTVDIELIVRQVTERLGSDVMAAFGDLSRPLNRKFSVEGLEDMDRAALTSEQRAGLRFKKVTKALVDQLEFAKFADIEAFAPRNVVEAITQFDGSETIGEIASDGAAVPSAAANAIERVVFGALTNESLGDVAAEELRDLTHRNRRPLLGEATHNITEFLPAINVLGDKVGRNEKGELVSLNGGDVLPKGSLDVYAAIALGCPALRLNHPDRALLTIEEKAAHGSANYIDHVLAVVINEAYDRGLFNLQLYKDLVPIVEQKRDERLKGEYRASLSQ